MEWMDFKDKKVFIEVKINSGIRNYSGVIEDVTFIGKSIDNVEVYFLMIIDKFGSKIGFPSTSINLIQEEK